MVYNIRGLEWPNAISVDSSVGGCKAVIVTVVKQFFKECTS